MNILNDTIRYDLKQLKQVNTGRSSWLEDIRGWWMEMDI